jgi:hypothetical protein
MNYLVTFPSQPEYADINGGGNGAGWLDLAIGCDYLKDAPGDFSHRRREALQSSHHAPRDACPAAHHAERDDYYANIDPDRTSSRRFFCHVGPHLGARQTWTRRALEGAQPLDRPGTLPCPP